MEEARDEGAGIEQKLMMRDAIDRALKMLPEELRDALVLRDVQGLEYREISETLGVPIGTVESRIFRARQRLRPLSPTFARRTDVRDGLRRAHFMTLNCNDAQPLIARYADDEPSLPPADRQALNTHLAECAGCRAALDEQRDVAMLLRARLETAPEPGLVARVSARIDREVKGPGSHGAGEPARGAGDGGWLGLVNWRAWTVGLAPVAAALLVAAYLDIGGTSSIDVTQTTVPVTLEEWTTATAPAGLQSDAGDEALIEEVLIGVAPSTGESDVR